MGDGDGDHRSELKRSIADLISLSPQHFWYLVCYVVLGLMGSERAVSSFRVKWVLRSLNAPDDFDSLYKRRILEYGRSKAGRVILTEMATSLAKEFEREARMRGSSILEDLDSVIKQAKKISFPRRGFRHHELSFLKRRPRVLVYQSTLEPDRSRPVIDQMVRAKRDYWKVFVLYGGSDTEKNAEAIGRELKAKRVCQDYELVKCDAYNSVDMADTIGKLLDDEGNGYEVDVAFDGSTRIAIPSTLAAIRRHSFEKFQNIGRTGYETRWFWSTPRIYDTRNRGRFSGNLRMWGRNARRFDRGLLISEFQLSRMEAYVTGLNVGRWDMIVPTTLGQEYANRVSLENAIALRRNLAASSVNVYGADYSSAQPLQTMLAKYGPYDVVCLGGSKVLCLVISAYWGTRLGNGQSCTLAYARLDWDSKDFSHGYGRCSTLSLSILPTGEIRFE